MGRDVVDVSVSERMHEREIILVLECYSKIADGLQYLREGSRVTLRYRDAEQKVRVYKEDGDECTYPYIEVGPQTARTLGLRDQARYLLDYDMMEDTVTFTRIVVSRAQTKVQTDNMLAREPRLTIGPALLASLGLNRQTGYTLMVRKDGVNTKVRLIVPRNQMSAEFRLSGGLREKLGLKEGEPVTLSYNQRTKLLYIGDTSSTSTGIRNADENHSSSMSSSGLSTSERSGKSRQGATAAKKPAFTTSRQGAKAAKKPTFTSSRHSAEVSPNKIKPAPWLSSVIKR